MKWLRPRPAIPLLVAVALATTLEHAFISDSGFLEHAHLQRSARGQDRTLLRYRAQLQRARESDAPKVFFLGSSQLRYAVDTRLLNLWFRDTGVEFYTFWQPNFAYPLSAWLMLDEMMAANPDAVIYMPSVRFLHRLRGEPFSLGRWKAPIRDYLQVGELAWLSTQVGWGPLLDGFETLAGALLGKSLLIPYLELAPDEIGDYAIGRTAPDHAWMPIDQRERHPFETVDPFESALARDEAAKYQQSLQLRRELDPLQLASLRQLAVDVIDQGSGFAILDAPHHPLFLRTRHGYIKPYASYLEALQSLAGELQFPVWGQQDLPHPDAEDFIDLDHLGTAQRLRFTRFVFELLRREIDRIAPHGRLAMLKDADDANMGWTLAGTEEGQFSLQQALQTARIETPISLLATGGNLVAETSRDSVRMPFAGARTVGRHKDHWKTFAGTDGQLAAGGYFVRYLRGQGEPHMLLPGFAAGQRCLGVRRVNVLDQGSYWRAQIRDHAMVELDTVRLYKGGEIGLEFSRAIGPDEVVEVDCFADARTLLWDTEVGNVPGLVSGSAASWGSDGQARQHLTFADTVLAAVPRISAGSQPGIWINGIYQVLERVDGIGTTHLTVEFHTAPPAGASLVLPVAVASKLTAGETVTVYPTFIE